MIEIALLKIEKAAIVCCIVDMSQGPFPFGKAFLDESIVQKGCFSAGFRIDLDQYCFFCLFVQIGEEIVGIIQPSDSVHHHHGTHIHTAISLFIGQSLLILLCENRDSCQ